MFHVARPPTQGRELVTYAGTAQGWLPRAEAELAHRRWTGGRWEMELDINSSVIDGARPYIHGTRREKLAAVSGMARRDRSRQHADLTYTIHVRRRAVVYAPTYLDLSLDGVPICTVSMSTGAR